MNAFEETSHYLKTLLGAKYLYPDAKADVEFMLRLHTSREYHLDRYSPIVLVYPFLVRPESEAGQVLRSVLRGFSGDLFQKLALDDARDYEYDSYGAITKSALPYPLEQDSLIQAYEYLGEPLHSGDLLTAFLVNPLSYWVTSSEADIEKDSRIYSLLRNRIELPDGIISRAHSEIASFLCERKINPNQLVMRLKGYGEPLDEAVDIYSRYSLFIGILPSGYLKAQILERWGEHELSETTGLTPAAHGLWLPEDLLFLKNEIEEFEALINAIPSVPEEAYQEFFEAHPKWLYLLGEQYEGVKSQVRLPPLQIHHELSLIGEPVDRMCLRPDFLLKRIGLDLWDVLDIKVSDCRLIVGRKSRNKFSEIISDALAQLREYSRRLQQNEIRAYVKKQYDLNISEPMAMVLVGRDFDFKTLHSKSQFRSSEGVRVYTYDDLHRLAKHRSVFL